EPGLAARLHDRRAGAVGERCRVVDPVDGIRVAQLAGDVGGGGVGREEDLLLLAGDALDGDRRRRRAGAHDHVDMLGVVPAARQRSGNVGLVLDVARDQLDLLAENRAAEIGDRHLGGDDGARTVDVGIEARQIGGDADLDRVVRDLRPRRRSPSRQDARQSTQHTTLHRFRSHGLFCCLEPSKVVACRQSGSSTMIESIRDIATRDGEMETFIVHPDRGAHPVVLFLMDAPGIRAELYDMARRLATVGYYVMLPNLYYRAGKDTKYGPDVLEKGSAEQARMRAVRTKMTIPPVMDDVAAMIAYADTKKEAKKGPVGTHGYCMSGPYSLAAAAR